MKFQIGARTLARGMHSCPGMAGTLGELSAAIMIRHALAVVVFTAAPVGCGCDDDGPPNQPSAPPTHASDATPEDRTPTPADAAPDHRLTLAGTWRGEADTEDYGRITAELWVAPEGGVTYTVTGDATTMTGDLRIDSWDGRVLRVRDREDRSFELPATLRDDTFTARLPLVGEVVLIRIRAAGERTGPLDSRGDAATR